VASGRIPWCPHRKDEEAAGALTVAGQWRIFTAFPNILVSLRDGWCTGLKILRRKSDGESW
jgi:hypothetical protein